MPVMDGVRVLQSIHQVCRLKSWSPPSVVLCTGYDARDVAVEMTQKQLPCSFLQKPVSRDELVQVVHRQCIAMTG
jgi:CheY-like chemotaxis protein